MANLPESPQWADGVYQIERNDPVGGGPDGAANKPLKDLTNRTRWLYEKFGTAFDNLGWMQLGEWAVGLEVSLPTQIVYYNGSWYRYRGNLDAPYVIAGESPEEDGGVWSGENPDGVWVDVGDASLRADLTRPGGASIPALRQGGNVQEAISYVTPEMLGHSTDTDSASDAFDAFIELAKSGICTKLVLKANAEYRLTRNHKFTVPVTIEGGSAVFTQSDQYGSTTLVDGRGANTTGWLIEFANGESEAVLGYNLSGFQVLGNQSENNQGVLFSSAGWTNNVRNILIRNFSKQGLAFLHVNDSTYDHIQVLGCGGLVDGTPYYAVDMLPNGTAQTGWVNNSLFNRLHIEHSRYPLRLACWFTTFVAAHIEKGSTFVATDDMSPMINIGPIARAINFVSCAFVSPRWEDYIPDDYDVSEPATVLDAIPAMFDTTYSQSEILVLNEYETRIKFEGCNFTTTSGKARYIKLPFVPVDIINAHISGASMYRGTPSVLVGPRSTVANCFFILVGVTNDTSVFATYINGVFAPAVYQQLVYGTFTGNTFVLNGFTGSSLGAIVAGNPSLCTSSGNKLVGFTNLFSGLLGEQVQNGMRIRTTSNALDLSVAGLDYNASSFYLRNRGASNESLYTIFDNSNTEFYSMHPSQDGGTSHLGSPSARWTTVYAKTGTINTSDRRSKIDETEISETEKRVAVKLKGLIRRFRYIPSETDDPTKLRFGVIAQDVVSVFESEGLDASDYGVVQYASWEAVDAIYDEQGGLISEARSAGDRYGVNYSELLCFIISAI
ncbi:tail fiber domain-containing protein [Pectobacterium brasiliense]|uniref:tail fiber domain-containing protein n=1 Tax=Pectobacterium brasiliense TaxID=180957 RepID=UPI00202D419D|nr:tail fiber domain-containing protein [Pectobacterium brasiliense]MCL6378700.1 tail fiber domain-containing protein [Pectobacterium brasiliense]